MNTQLFSWCVLAPLCSVSGTAADAQSAGWPVFDEAASAAMPVAAPPPLLGLDGRWEGRALTRVVMPSAYLGGAVADEALPIVSIVTLPPAPRPGGPPGRNHHALSLRNDSSTQALRSMGFEVSDCATRFRFPSRFKQSSANAEGGFEASAQVSWLCRF